MITKKKRFPRIQALSKRDGFPYGRFQVAGKFTSRALASEATKFGKCLVSACDDSSIDCPITQDLLRGHLRVAGKFGNHTMTSNRSISTRTR